MLGGMVTGVWASIRRRSGFRWREGFLLQKSDGIELTSLLSCISLARALLWLACLCFHVGNVDCRLSGCAMVYEMAWVLGFGLLSSKAMALVGPPRMKS